MSVEVDSPTTYLQSQLSHQALHFPILRELTYNFSDTHNPNKNQYTKDVDEPFEEGTS